MLDANAEKRFLILKKRLDTLHYTQPFNIESTPLVEHLFNDLVKITEAFQGLKRVNEELQITANRAEEAVKPHITENLRLSKENNALHYEIMKIKEANEEIENRWRVREKILEGDKNDLKFVLQQKEVNYRKLEDDVKNPFNVLNSFIVPCSKRKA